MTRHSIPALDPNHEVTVGWDAPMRTFFAHVQDAALEAKASDLADAYSCGVVLREGEEKLMNSDTYVLKVGENYDAIKEAEALAEAIADYAVISDEMIDQLKADAGVAHTPTPLQRLGEALSREATAS